MSSVHQVTSALVDAELGFVYSPESGGLWILEFEGDRQLRLFLNADEADLLVTAPVPASCLPEDEEQAEFDDVVMVARLDEDLTIAVVALPLDQLADVSDAAYHLLDAVLSMETERKGKRKGKTKAKKGPKGSKGSKGQKVGKRTSAKKEKGSRGGKKAGRGGSSSRK